jgi:choline dehydrogenase-like flavoprotein
MSQVVDGEPLNADICIIGAGAAGISLAVKLRNSGLNILIVESGGRRHEAPIQALYSGHVTDSRLHATPDRFRRRQFGGSTVLWGGRCVPFDPIDFEPRCYIPHSGWPLSYNDILPFYREANEVCEAGAFAYQIDEAFDRPTRPMIAGFASSDFRTDELERFSKPTDFAARYRATLDIAGDVRVLLHATATQLIFDSNGRVLEKVKLRSLSGKTATAHARTFVLATGGLEVPRLLLANRDAHPAGVGNGNDVVGRYYMCHIAGTLGRITIDRSASTVWNDYDIADDGTYCRRRLSLHPEAQRREKIGNFIARLHHPRIADPEHRTAILSLVFLGSRLLPWEYRTRVAPDYGTTWHQYRRHVANVAAAPLSAAGFAARMLTGRFLAERKIPSLVVKSKADLFSIDFHAEQIPNRESRITLADDTDAFGMPRIKIDWHYTRQDVETVEKAVAMLASDFSKSGVGTFEYDRDAVEAEMIRYGAYGGHHIGTARMGTDAHTSVVDQHCRVHGIDNLYVAGAATFPTSSQANPTLTIVALSLRLAGHLKEKLRKPFAIPAVETSPV